MTQKNTLRNTLNIKQAYDIGLHQGTKGKNTPQNMHELHLMLADMDSLISYSVRGLIVQHIHVHSQYRIIYDKNNFIMQ